MERVVIHADDADQVSSVRSAVDEVIRPAGPTASVARSPTGPRSPERAKSTRQQGHWRGPDSPHSSSIDRSAFGVDRSDSFRSRSSGRRSRSPPANGSRPVPVPDRGGSVRFSLPSRRPANRPVVVTPARRLSNYSFTRSPDLVPNRQVSPAQRRDSRSRLIDPDLDSVQDQSTEDPWSPSKIFGRCRSSFWGTLTLAGVILLITILIVIAIATRH